MSNVRLVLWCVVPLAIIGACCAYMWHVFPPVVAGFYYGVCVSVMVGLLVSAKEQERKVKGQEQLIEFIEEHFDVIPRGRLARVRGGR
jgi:hypothetical protein